MNTNIKNFRLKIALPMLLISIFYSCEKDTGGINPKESYIEVITADQTIPYNTVPGPVKISASSRAYAEYSLDKTNWHYYGEVKGLFQVTESLKQTTYYLFYIHDRNTESGYKDSRIYTINVISQ